MSSQGLKNSSLLGSSIASQSYIAKNEGRRKKPLLFNLTLTSLIDAFSILVIFLLSQAGNNQNTFDLRGVQLPQAQSATAVAAEGIIVKVIGNDFFVGDTSSMTGETKKVTKDELTQALIDVKKKHENDPVIVQADRKLAYSEMNPIILAAAQAGIEKFQFAVLPSGKAN